MERAGQREFTAAVEAARARIASWRRDCQGRRRRMPEALWQAAARLARVHGINQVARALRLDYYNLKRRVDGRQEDLPPAAAPVFVELGAGDNAASSGCVLEMEAPGGARLTVRLRDPGNLDFVSLAEALWRRRR